MDSNELPLNWNRAPHVSARITWTAEVYEHLSGECPAIEPPWRSLPFEVVHLDKLPPRSGLYAITYAYQCLGFPKQEIIMYVGEADNLQSRFSEYKSIASANPIRKAQQAKPQNRRLRLRYLFTKFDKLSVQYCTTEASQEERKNAERELISLLDPPFNWRHRPNPITEPTIGHPSDGILMNPMTAQSAFR